MNPLAAYASSLALSLASLVLSRSAATRESRLLLAAAEALAAVSVALWRAAVPMPPLLWAALLAPALLSCSRELPLVLAAPELAVAWRLLRGSRLEAVLVLTPAAALGAVELASALSGRWHWLPSTLDD